MRDEGKPQPITLFDNTPTPIRLIVMLDVSGSMEGNLPLLRAAAAAIVRAAAPEDRARVGSFGHEITISPTFTRDPAHFERALPGDCDPTRRRRCGARLTRRSSAFESDSEERRVILVLSDGKDSGPIGFRQPFVSQVEVIERARAEDVMVYAIGMRSRSSQSRRRGLDRAACRRR